MLRRIQEAPATEHHEPIDTEWSGTRVERYERLVRLHAREIQQFLLKLCGSVDDAEELAQDVFVKAYRKLDTLREARAARRWLYRIAVNRFHDWIKPRRHQAARQVEGLELDPPGRPATDPQQSAMARELSDWLDTSIELLPQRQRTVLILHSIRGFDYQSIAEVLGISADAVKMSLFHAREKLRRGLDSYYDRTEGQGI